MACPFFYPTEPMDDQHGPGRHPMPLGDCYAGECRASAVPCRPSEEELRKLCNLGYARGKCARFRPEQPADAVRFTVSRDAQGCVSIGYVQERDHGPSAHGTLQYLAPEKCFVAPHADANVQRQALAYVQAYLRRKAALAAAASAASSRR